MRSLRHPALAVFVGAFLLVLPAAASAADAVETPAGVKMRLGSPRIVHSLRLSALTLSADGKLLASGGTMQFGPGDTTPRVWDAATGKMLQQLAAHTQMVSALAFSADNKLIATAGNDGQVNIHEVSTGKTLQQLKGHMMNVASLAFSPDGQILVSGSWDKSVRLWDVATGKELHNLQGHAIMVFAVAFAPDGKTVASASTDGIIHLWDPATGKDLRSLDRHRQVVNSLAFSPDSQKLASGSADGTVRVWDPATGKELRQIGDPSDTVDYPDRCTIVSFSDDGKKLVTVWNEGQQVRVWDPATGKDLARTSIGQANQGIVSYSPGTNTLALGMRFSQDGLIRLYNAATGHEEAAPGHRREVCGSAYSPDGKLLATGSTDRTVRLWDTSNGKELHVLRGHTARVRFLSFSADGATLATASDQNDPAATVWDVATGKERYLLRTTGGFGYRDLLVTPDGKSLLTLGTDQFCRVWDLTTGKESQSYRLGNGFYFAAFSPDGKYVVSMIFNQTLKLWEVATGKEVRNIGGVQTGGVTALVFSPDARILALENQQRIVTLYDVATGQQLRQLGEAIPNPGRPVSLAFSPDGMTLASIGTKDGPAVRLWEIATGKERRQFKAGLSSPLAVLAFSPDAKTLVAGCSDSTALIWDVDGPPREGPAPELGAKELESLEADLIRAEADKAYQAVCALVGSPKQSVPFLQGKIKPVEGVDRKTLDKLIEDLDAKEFGTRKKATDELEKLGELAEVALHDAMKGQPSLEVKQRVEQLLQRLQGQQLTPDQLRTIRIIEVLEKIGTADARETLTAVAKGAPGARVTRDAEAALQRLSRRPVTMP